MPYTTRKELKTIFANLDDFNLDASGINAYITRADNIIDSKLSEAYSLPFSGTPPIVNDLSKNLTLFYILQRHYTQQVPNQSDWVDSLRAEVFGTLDALAKKEMTLVNSDGTSIEKKADNKQSLASTTQNYNPIFDMRDPIFQNVDPDRIDDEFSADE